MQIRLWKSVSRGQKSKRKIKSTREKTERETFKNNFEWGGGRRSEGS
jgi:hypothetical protein